jgi:hypothetical protein
MANADAPKSSRVILALLVLASLASLYWIVDRFIDVRNGHGSWRDWALRSALAIGVMIFGLSVQLKRVRSGR